MSAVTKDREFSELHGEEDANQRRAGDEDDGMQFLCGRYLIGNEPKYYRKNHSFPVEDAVAEQIGTQDAKTCRGDHAGGGGVQAVKGAVHIAVVPEAFQDHGDDQNNDLGCCKIAENKFHFSVLNICMYQA